MAIFRKGDRVEDVRTGHHGTVVQQHPSGVTTVSWDPNEHGGYVDHAKPGEVVHGDCNDSCECMGRNRA